MCSQELSVTSPFLYDWLSWSKCQQEPFTMTSSYMTLAEVAEFLGYTIDTLRLLVQGNVGPPQDPKLGKRCFSRDEIKRYRKKWPNSPNELFPLSLRFRRHDDGRWWPRLTRSRALAKGTRRYFDGTPCIYGHRVEQWTKNGKCVECCEIRSGRGRRY